MTVAALLASRPTRGTIVIIGYVAKVYHCPPCPTDAQCKPCMGDNLVLSDTPHRLESYADMNADEVIVFGEQTALDALALGSRYQVEVEVTARRFASQPVPDLRLLSASSAL